MTDLPAPPRSPRLLDPHASALVVIDMQERLLQSIDQAERIVGNAWRLLRGCQLLEVRSGVTEQYPQGLGSTDRRLQALIDSPVAKLTFSAAACQQWLDPLREAGVRQVVVCGLETHVCVLQTALDLLADGFDAYIVADAVGARHETDHELALRRMRDEGAAVVTTESVLFEWCRSASHPAFKQISALVKQSAVAPSLPAHTGR